MKPKNKNNRFINLAEQLNVQNEIVASTMDSMLKFVNEDESVETRSDFEQIKKTAEQINELNPAFDSIENVPTELPRPNFTRARSTKSQTETLEG